MWGRPGLAPASHPTPRPSTATTAPPASLTFALGSRAIETATHSSGPQSTSCRMKGPRSEAGRGEGGATGGAGPGRWDQEAGRTGWGGEKGAALLCFCTPYNRDGLRAMAFPAHKVGGPGVAPWWWSHYTESPQRLIAHLLSPLALGSLQLSSC